MIRWVRPSEEVAIVRTSKIEGRGVFATQDLPKYCIVTKPLTIKSKPIFALVDYADIRKKNLTHVYDYSLLVDRQTYAVDPAALYKGYGKLKDDYENYFNHSCDPNCVPWGIVDILTRKKVKKGEELTFDYSTINSSVIGGGPARGMKCACDEPKCRERIHSLDWRSFRFQRQYWPFFTTYLQTRILMFLMFNRKWKQLRRLTQLAENRGFSIGNF